MRLKLLELELKSSSSTYCLRLDAGNGTQIHLQRDYRGKPDVFIRFPEFDNFPKIVGITVAHPLRP